VTTSNPAENIADSAKTNYPVVAGWTQLNGHTYVRSSPEWGANTGLIVGSEKALVIDTGGGPRQAKELVAAVREITDLPLTLANTHAHYDHLFGNAYFRNHEGVMDIWAHHSVVRDLLESGLLQRKFVRGVEPEMEKAEGLDTEIDYPNRLLEETPVDLDLGGVTATLFFLGRAHSEGDMLVGADGVLFAGDIVEEGGHPSFEDSFPHEWQRVLGKIIAIDELYPIVVPGHGQPVDMDFVRMQFHKLRQGIRVCEAAIHEASTDYTKAIPVLPYGPLQSRHLLQRLKKTTARAASSED